MQSQTRRLYLLGIGAALGLFLAVLGLVERWTFSSSALPVDAIARVGDHSISRERYKQVLSDLENDRRSTLNSEDRQFVLNRLIDEELLILRGLELGLAEAAPEVRKAIAAAVITQVVTEAEALSPNDADLKSLYESDPEYFTRPARYRVWWLQVSGVGAAEKELADSVYKRLSKGDDLNEVLASSGMIRSDLLPDVLLPLSKINQYLGSTLIHSMQNLQVENFTIPISTNGAFHILYLVGFEAAVLPRFEEIRSLLDVEYTRRSGDRALREYLQWLRLRADISIETQGRR